MEKDASMTIYTGVVYLTLMLTHCMYMTAVIALCARVYGFS